MPITIYHALAPREILALPEDRAGAVSESGYLKPNTVDFPAGYPRGLLVAETTVNGQSFYTPYLASAVSVFNCESSFDELTVSGVTNSTVSDCVTGSLASKISIASTVSAGTKVASKAISSTNLSTKSKILFWIQSSKGLASGDLQLLLDDTASIASPNVSLDIPSIAPGVWTLVELDVSGASSATISVGIKYVNTSALAGIDILLDDIRAFSVTGTPKAVLKEPVNYTANALTNVNGETGYRTTVYTHGVFFKNKLVGLDSAAITALAGTLSASNTVLSF